jgi:succinyl-diaminopimelate desuccinylase
MIAGAARLESMIALLQELVGHSSQAGIDSPEPVIQVISDWLRSRNITHEWIRDDADRPLGLAGDIRGTRDGPTYLLDATVDTAPFGDTSVWNYPADRPTIVDGWLYGRGSADSKAGVSVFCHVLADLFHIRDQLSGCLSFVFDADEHSGGFAGIRRYMATRRDPTLTGVMIGYPGNERLVTGGRGFSRARLIIYGIGAHSGSSSNRGVNAIDRARTLLQQLAATPLPGPDSSFPLAPKITATAIRGGGSFALIPDRCELEMDIRLTPVFDDAAARTLIAEIVADFDAVSAVPPTEMEWLPGWPAFHLYPSNPMVEALLQGAQEAFGRTVPAAVAGPSSIANYLSTLGIPATAGFGVTYRGTHGPDECVLLETLEPTFATYRQALIQLLQ